MHTKINLRIQFDNMMIFRIAESIKRLQETIYPKWSSTRTNTPPRPHTAPAATFSTNSERPQKTPSKRPASQAQKGRWNNFEGHRDAQ